jgi:phosphoribosylformylglycinamidine synthase
LPAIGGKYFVQQAALTHNDSGLFRNDWVFLKANPQSPCVFTKGLDIMRLPVRHGEGKFVAESQVLEEIVSRNLTVLQYCDSAGKTDCPFPMNPNGSLLNIAGICDQTGRIFGLMPHPEAFLSPFNAPDWTIEKLKGPLPSEGEGVQIFRNAAAFAAENLL